MLNKVILIGRLTREPDLRYTPSGTPVAKFTLAVDRRTNKQGERQADFIDIITWQKIAETCAKHLGKGRLVAVEGRLQIRSYEDSQSIRRKAAEVIAETVRFLDRAKNGQSQKPADGADDGDFASGVSFVDDDMPF